MHGRCVRDRLCADRRVLCVRMRFVACTVVEKLEVEKEEEEELDCR